MAYPRMILWREEKARAAAHDRGMLDSPYLFVRVLVRVCLVAGPLMFAASSLFWEETGRYNVISGTLIVLCLPVWAFGMVALFERMRPVLPRFSAAAILLTLAAVVGGASFGYQGFFEEAYSIDKPTAMAGLAEYPIASGLMLWWIGPLFPTTIILLGAATMRTRQLPVPVGLLLVAAGVLFPVSRAPRIEWIAHVVDLLLVAAFVLAAFSLRRLPGTSPHPATN